MYETFEKLLEKNKVTAYQVCKETGIKQSTISDWKAGKYTPKVDKMRLPVLWQLRLQMRY